MKKKILAIAVLLSLCFYGQAQFLKFIGGLLVGAATAYVDHEAEKSDNAQLKETWNTAKSYLPGVERSHSYEATRKAMNGDYEGAALSAASAVAVAAGVNESTVALTNSGITNWLNGDTKAGAIDLTQASMRAFFGENASTVDYFYDAQREMNQANNEYRENIRNGMSEADARAIKGAKTGTIIGNVIRETNELAKERDRKDRQAEKRRERELREAIGRRGYSESEAEYLGSIIVAQESPRIIDGVPEPPEQVLDRFHVGYRSTPSDGDFFYSKPEETEGPSATEPEPPATSVTVSVPEPEPEPEPDPAEIERENAIIAIEETVVDSYKRNSINLSRQAKSQLDEIAEKMKQYDDLELIILGHTCDLGDDEVNQSVAMMRALRAKKYLVKKGVANYRILVGSHGDSAPVVANDSDENRKLNRRISFQVHENR